MKRIMDSHGNIWIQCPICHYMRVIGEVTPINVFIQSPEGQQEKTVECCGSCYAWLKAKNFIFDEGVPK